MAPVSLTPSSAPPEEPARSGLTPEPTPPTRRAALRARAAAAVERLGLPRPRLALGSLAALCLMILAMAIVPVPYVVQQPGPAIDVLGTYEKREVLSISGAQTHPTDGTLMMTTVSVDGGPGYVVTPVEVVAAWFQPTRSVFPRELFFPEGQTREETTLENTVQMNTSQQGSVAVALDELGIRYETTVFVAGVLEGAPADGVLKAGDVVTAIGGESANDPAGFQALAARTTPGQDVQMTVKREGKELKLSVPTEEVDGKPRMGISLARGYDFPMDVHISIGRIGGPSAGMIFSLAVYDELTPGALTGGKKIAGTGTIDEKGMVGPIGGIRQKMAGARDSGADYFLAPSKNCAEVTGYVPDGLQVVSVGTFDEALTATQQIASTGKTTGLPTCEEK